METYPDTSQHSSVRLLHWLSMLGSSRRWSSSPRRCLLGTTNKEAAPWQNMYSHHIPLSKTRWIHACEPRTMYFDKFPTLMGISNMNVWLHSNKADTNLFGKINVFWQISNCYGYFKYGWADYIQAVLINVAIWNQMSLINKMAHLTNSLMSPYYNILQWQAMTMNIISYEINGHDARFWSENITT